MASPVLSVGPDAASRSLLFLARVLQRMNTAAAPLDVQVVVQPTQQLPLFTSPAGEFTQVNTIARALATALKVPAALGAGAEGQASVAQWLTFAASAGSKDTALEEANAALAGTSFMGAGASITIADVIALFALHPRMAALAPEEAVRFIHLSRWYDQVQHDAAVIGTEGAPAMLDLSCLQAGIAAAYAAAAGPVATAPVATGAAGGPAAGAGAGAGAGTSGNAAAASGAKKNAGKNAPAAAAGAGGDAKAAAKAAKAAKKEKKKKEKKAKKPAPPPASEISKCQFLVGKINKAWEHPEKDDLMCEEIDVGEAAPRLIVSGLRKFYTAAQMTGRLVLVAANLKPRAFGGLKSAGMVLCASNADHTAVELLHVPEGTPVGERVMFEGFPGEPAAPGPMTKKRVLEKLIKAGKLVTTSDLVAVYKSDQGDVPFSLTTGVVKAASLTGATVG